MIGAGRPHHSSAFFIWGLQFPGPLEFFGLSPRTLHSVWYPSTITAWVSSVLLGLAAASLVRRGAQIWRSQQDLRTITDRGREQQIHQANDVFSRAQHALTEAARCMNLPPACRLPPVFLVNLRGPTPLLLGLRQPCILLSPHLAAELTDAEMEMAFRHELAHLLRRDHLWRWPLMWMVDVGRITGIVGWLAAEAGAEEEELCDRLAVRSVAEAVLMGSALTKSANILDLQADVSVELPVSLRTTVVPSLLGQTFFWQIHTRAYQRRLKHLIQLAREWQLETVSSSSVQGRYAASQSGNAIKTKAARFLFGLLLFLIVYIKYIVRLNVF